MVYETITVPFRGWTVVREIGQGSFGKVYEIRRDRYGLAERSAMKVIAIPQNTNEIRTYLRDGYSPAILRKMYDGSRASVLTEYQMMARLKDCPNIVRCEDIEVVMDPDGISSKTFIRMELLTPISEYDKLQSFSDKEVIKLGSDICNMLTRCEAEGIVHRDIKPGNIMVSDQGDYKLGDFGIARSMDHTTMATMIGTMNYMAPEVYLGRKYGHTADIYSLGLVLYWLMNNRRMPFFPQNDSEIKSSSAATAQEKRMTGTPIPRPANGGPGIVRVVLKALSYDPGDRYQSAVEFGNEIRKCLSGERSYVIEDGKTGVYLQNSIDGQTSTEFLNNKNDRQKIYETEMNLKREQHYQECISLMKAASSIPEYENAKTALMSMHGYKDTNKLVEECQKEINRLNEQKRLEEEREAAIQKRPVEEAAGKRKKILGILAVTVVLCAIAVLIVTKVIIPHNIEKRKMELLAQAEVGSTVQFGRYEQDNITSNGEEPVEWIVLEKNENALLVISKDALDCKPYNETDTDITWESSSLRKWLNNIFLHTAFSNTELKHIAYTSVRAETDPGTDTQDQVFLLSVSEAEKYFGSDSERKCTCTAYAKALGANSDNSGQCWWWLRSPGYYSIDAAHVLGDGSVYYNGSLVSNARCCVRPVLWINLDPENEFLISDDQEQFSKEKDQENNADLSNSKYVGTWKNTGISIGTESGQLDVEFTLIIKGDGTGELVSEGETSSFTWKPTDKGFKTDGDMKLTFTDDGENIKATIIGAELTFEKQAQ